jgi:predicted negative regulator of RcsB-dependent stress response
MARHLDLEEQEQLDELKHFWNKYGNLITWLLTAVLAAYAGYTGWQWWQRNQAAQASVLHDEVERATEAGDLARVERALADMQEKFGRTTYARQSALTAAKAFAEKGKPDAAKAALQWVADKSGDEGYQAIARLRLAGLLADTKAYDEALKQLAAGMPKEFEPLAADRRGDIYSLQGKKAEAKAEYTKALQGLDERADYRNVVDVKLTALGVDTSTLKPAATAASGAAKS